MSTTSPIDYEAVIADLEAKKAHLETMIAGLRSLAGMTGLGTVPPGAGPGSGVNANGRIASDAFFGKSIPEAAVVHLGNVRRKLSTQALMDAMEAGGLPKSKYNTVYAILRRRESMVGDIINMQGEWGLAAWYPNHVKAAKAAAAKKGVVSESATGEANELDEALAGDSDEESEIDPAGEMKATA
jgi:hypothetical protein